MTRRRCMERASIATVTRNLAAGIQRGGVQAQADGPRYNAAVALTGGRAGPGGDRHQHAMVWRAAGLPVRTAETTLHVGVSGEWVFRPANESGKPRTFGFSDRKEPQIHNAAPSLSTPSVPADSGGAFRPRLALTSRQLWLQGEFCQILVNRQDQAGVTLDFNGTCAQAAYAVLGMPRTWQPSIGAFTAPKPAEGFDPATGQFGAVEMGVRPSAVDLNKELSSGHGQVHSAVINWWPVEPLRFSLLYEHANIPAGPSPRTLNTAAGRATPTLKEEMPRAGAVKRRTSRQGSTTSVRTATQLEEDRMPFSRRKVLSAGAAAGMAGAASTATTALAAGFGNPDSPAQGIATTQGNPRAAVDPGPQNPAIVGQFPKSFIPPATDVGDMAQFWASFNNAPRRIQDGGWARLVTQSDFQIAEEISGVNMRLAAGGVRELHWHQAAEWAYMSYGNCRVTVMDTSGRAYVADVREGDLWYFPAGYPHSLQGLGPDGCEFILAFDSGKQSEYNTLLVTDWLAHTPPDVLAENFGVPADTFSKIFTHNLWIFQGAVPGPLAADQDAVKGPSGPPPNPFTYSLANGPVVRQTKGGRVQVADSHNFKAATTVAAALVTVHPGGLREMHWHPNADEWQYYVKGAAQMTVFNTGPNAVTNNFNPGDIGYIKRNLGHYIRNVGDTDLVFLEIFRSDSFQDMSLSDWLTHVPPALVAAHFNVSPQDIAKFPKGAPAVVPS